MASAALSAPPPAAAPASCTQLFTAFTRLALQGFGGVLPVAQHELVERLGWVDREEFLRVLSVAQVLPGPNVVNLALILGDRFFGWRGALAACSGMLLLPLLIVLAATVFYQQVAHLPVFAGALRGMGAVAAGLVIATGAKLVVTLKRHPLGRGVALCYAGLAALLVGGLRWPMVGVVLGLGTLTMLHVAWVLRQRAPQ